MIAAAVSVDDGFCMMRRTDIGESIVLVQNWGQIVDQRLSSQIIPSRGTSLSR